MPVERCLEMREFGSELLAPPLWRGLDLSIDDLYYRSSMEGYYEGLA